jgi:hypothetical protein
MDTYCGRAPFGSFSEAAYDCQLPLLTTGEIHVPAWPISSVRNVYLNWQSVLQVSAASNVTLPSLFTTNTPGSLNLTSVVAGVYTTTPLTYASNPTLGQLVTAINNVSGWSATINSKYNSYPSADIIEGQNLQQNGVPLNVWDSTSVSQYTVDPRRGIIRIGMPFSWFAYDWDTSSRMNPLSPPFFQDRVRVVWTGGYNDSGNFPWPADLNYVIAELTGFYFDGKQGQVGMENFDNRYQYSLTDDKDRIPLKCKQILDAYRERWI